MEVQDRARWHDVSAGIGRSAERVPRTNREPWPAGACRGRYCRPLLRHRLSCDVARQQRFDPTGTLVLHRLTYRGFIQTALHCMDIVIPNATPIGGFSWP